MSRIHDLDLNYAAIRFQVIITGEARGEMWQADQDYATRRPEAQALARELLAFGRPPSAGEIEVELTAYIYEGQLVNVGTDIDPDWTFEPTPSITTEVIR